MQDTQRTVVDSLYRISSLVNNTEDPREALEFIIDEITKVLPTASASIDLINPDSGLLEIEVFRGLPEHSKGIQLRLGQGVTGWVALHGKPLLVEDVSEDQRYIPVKDTIRSELAVPMHDHGTVIGVVNVDSEEVGAFNEDHLKILSLLTNEATKVVSRLWLINQLRQKAAQLQALVNAGRQLGGKLNLRNLLESIVEEARKIMRCRLCALFLFDSSESTLTLEALAGVKLPKEFHEDLNIKESAIGTAIRRQKQVEVYDLKRTEEHHFIELIQSEDLRSMLATPLVYEGQVIGVLNAYTNRPHRFNNDERRLLSTLASFSALAIQNARLYARVFQSEETLRRNERLTTLGLLSAEIAHEIRNPLTVIRLLFDSLELEDDSDEMRRQDATIISEKLNQLDGIVTRVLSFGKSSGGLHSRYDLVKIIGDTLHLVRLKLAQSRVALEFDSEADSLTIDANKGQIQQAILNLIINALQAMPHGGRLGVSVREDTIGDSPHGIVEIKDSGKGIDPKIRERVFESFLSNKPQGTGLGLGIVKRIVKSHHGDIEVADSGPAGTTMRLWLPLARGQL